jgi:hypothetical protein
LIFSTQVASAQEVPVAGQDILGTTFFDITPATPGPNQDATVAIEGSGLDLDTANLTWLVNGQNVKSGRGVKSITLRTGSVGTNTTIRVIISVGGSTYYKSTVIIPSSIDLLWQGNTYTPPFYKGLSLWSKQSLLTLLAVPQVGGAGLVSLNSKNLIYKWILNGNILGGASGVGKNSLVLSDTILSLTKNISVEVYTDQDTIAGTASISLSPASPKLLVYENNPLYGFMFNNEVGDKFVLNKEEITFANFPYFFSTPSRSSDVMSYMWKTNAGDLREGTSQVTFRTNSNEAGESNVHSEAQHDKIILQGASKDFLVQFGNQNAI